MSDIIDFKQYLSGEKAAPPEPPWLKQMPRTAKDALLLKLIQQVGLLHGMTRADVLNLLYIAQRVIHPAGDYIFREGDDSGQSLYILIMGKADVLIKSKIAPGKSAEAHAAERLAVDSMWEETVLATLTPGETFGEMALVDSGARSASVKAVDQCVCLKVLAPKLATQPDIAAKLYLNIAGLLSKRLRATHAHLLECLHHESKDLAMNKLPK